VRWAPPTLESARRFGLTDGVRTLYIDAFSGISGDMTVGALLALGMPLEHLRQELAKLPLTGYSITAAPRLVHAIQATKFDVHIADPAAGPHADAHEHAREHGHAHHHRAFRDIRRLIEGSGLDAGIQRTALAIFTTLAAAEGRVHGVAPDDVTFHEVGAVDSIVDIVGTAIGVAWLQIERAVVSPLPLGSGTVQSQHGPIPVPGPATVELLRGFPTRPGDGEGELVTPTGAAIVAALATPGAAPDLQVAAVGYGAGTRTLRDRPNLLRLILGDTQAASVEETGVVIETNIDDYNPEFYEYVMERLLVAGARDVTLTPVHMKKNRPGVVLSVLCTEETRAALASILLTETSTVGVRYHPVRRIVLAREIREVGTPYGMIRVKVATGPDGHVNVAPEYDDCRRLAHERNVPIKTVYQEALANALASQRAR
jgi:uncharacterized protein (TIGR00299 family) protein